MWLLPSRSNESPSVVLLNAFCDKSDAISSISVEVYVTTRVFREHTVLTISNICIIHLSVHPHHKYGFSSLTSLQISDSSFSLAPMFEFVWSFEQRSFKRGGFINQKMSNYHLRHFCNLIICILFAIRVAETKFQISWSHVKEYVAKYILETALHILRNICGLSVCIDYGDDVYS